MTEMVEVRINDRWPLVLPSHRAERVEWPYWEKERLASMAANLKPGMIVYDIGAEEGDLPALWASWGCRVVCVEPNPRVWPNIRACFEGNDLEPLACFAGFAGAKTRGAAPLNVSEWPDVAYGSVIRDHGFLQLSQHPDVPAITVDEIASSGWVAPPDALTLDVEGSEMEVIKGAQRTLEEHKPLVWISVHPEFMFDQYGAYEGELHTLLHQHGYVKHHLAFDHEHHWLYFRPDVHSVRLHTPTLPAGSPIYWDDVAAGEL